MRPIRTAQVMQECIVKDGSMLHYADATVRAQRRAVVAESGLARTLLAKFAATGGLTLALRWPYARRWRRPRPNCENPAKFGQNLGKI